MPTIFFSLVFIPLSCLVSPSMGMNQWTIMSPLQSLTIPDAQVKETIQTPREKFLDKFAAGIAAEADTRKALAEKRKEELEGSSTSADSDWASETLKAINARQITEDEVVEQAYDRAVAEYEASLKKNISNKPVKKSPKDAYQFVGVVNRKTGEKPITWYARKKPANAKWTVRLVHVNRDAIVKDLFNRGKVDLFAKYRNTGIQDEKSNIPIVVGKYEVRERTWRNLWNFSPKRFFTDSSGMYWRERRLQPGIYTDGATVYEATYRYRTGRNGMHKVASLQSVLDSNRITEEQKATIKRRLVEDSPDLVIESS